MISKCTSLCHNYHHNQNMVCTLTKTIRRSLIVDTRRRAERAVEEIRACLEPTLGKPDPWGAYTVLKQ